MLRTALALTPRAASAPFCALRCGAASRAVGWVPVAFFGRASYWPKPHDSKGQEQVAHLQQLVFDDEAHEETQRLLHGLVRRDVEWKPELRRTGVIARKIGMMQLYDDYGERHPVTVLHLDRCQVIQTKPDQVNQKEQVNMQLGAGSRPIKKVQKPLRGHFSKHGVEPKIKVLEFNVSPEALLPEGLELDVRHFLPGQFVDVRGITKGKGFAGVMKRWGFGGLPASHGVSLAHRSHGSTGDVNAGRVYPGKKMAGRLGGHWKMVMNIPIFKLDVERSLIIVRGAVPGPTGSWVTVSDAHRKPRQFTEERHPPFPTFVPKGEPWEEEKQLFAPLPEVNPFQRDA